MHWLLALPVAVIAVLPIQAERPLRMTTEGAEYCAALAARLDAVPQLAAGWPRELGAEGRRLCTMGLYRPGIARLRRALRAAQAEPRRN